MGRSAAAILIISALACGPTEGRSDHGEGRPDIDPPLLRVESPARGTILDGSTVLVRGWVHDEASGIDSVSVNGQAAQVAGDDSFEVKVTVEPGIALLETVANDRAGNAATDRRAVLSGRFEPHDSPIENALVAHIGRPALDALAGMITNLGNQTDFGPLAQQFNPVLVASAPCFRLTINARDILKSGVAVTDLSFVNGGLEMTIEIYDLDADMSADYTALCFPGQGSFRLRASTFRITGRGSLALSPQGSYNFQLDDLTGQFQGFSFQAFGISSSVLDVLPLVDINQWVANWLSNRLMSEVAKFAPPMVRNYLAELEAGEWSLPLFQHLLHVNIRPKQLQIDGQGATIAVESKVLLEGVEDASYVSTPTSPPTRSELAAAGKSLRVGVADEVANQILASFWASGTMEQSLPISDESSLKALLGDEVTRIDYRVLLPPMAQVDPLAGTARLTFGDLLVDTVDEQGQILDRYAASGSVDLNVSLDPDFRLKVETGEQDLIVSIVQSRPNSFITKEQLIAFGSFAISDMAARVDQLLGALPIPALGNATLTSPSIDSSAGYLLLGADVHAMSGQ